MASVYEKISAALSSLGKRKERDLDAASPQQPSAKKAPKFRPWEQKDLHKRLETYRPLTWFAKPASVSAIVCASKGWVNDARESLCCEFCSARLVYPDAPYDQKQAAANMFAPSLTSKHTSTCPWKSGVCSDSLLAYTPSSPVDLCQQFELLQDKLLKIDVLPELKRVTEIMEVDEEPFTRHVLGSTSSDTSLQCQPSTSDNVISSSILVQPSKLTIAQKAKLLALLGWDTDVLPPDTSSAVEPLTQSSSYSLQHLLGKRGSASSSSPTATALATVAAPAPTKHSMSSVVLKCHLCNSKVGLWNFAAVKPSPIGRFSASGGTPFTAALPSIGTSVSGTPLGGDPLSRTIAGGSFGDARTTRASFRFGSNNASDPVFGLSASDTPKTTTAPFGSPIDTNSGGGKRKAPATSDDASTASPSPSSKRTKITTPAPPFAGFTTPASKSGAAAAVLSASKVPLPSMPATPNILAQGDQPLDPLGQHRSWCPWVYTGDPNSLTTQSPKFRCGWRCTLDALDAQSPATAAGAGHASERDPQQLAQEVLQTIRRM